MRVFLSFILVCVKGEEVGDLTNHLHRPPNLIVGGTRLELACILLSNFTGMRRFFWFLHSSLRKISGFDQFVCILEDVFLYLSF